VSRLKIAVGVLLLWLIGLAVLARRELGKSEADRLVEGSQRIDPATYYYTVTRDGNQIGGAFSTIDTSGSRLRATYYFRGVTGIPGDSGVVEQSSVAYLSRRFVLDSVALMTNGENQYRAGKAGRMNRSLFRIGRSYKSSLILPRALLPVALMLSRNPTIGRSAMYWMYNPIGERVSRVTLRITAESLFTVSDSATYNAATAEWTTVHSDTVRAWSVVATGFDGRIRPLAAELTPLIGVPTGREVTPTALQLSTWVDAQGRIVSATGPGGVQILRTAYEIAHRGCFGMSHTHGCRATSHD
jgi:hypothetical protein